MIPVAPDQLLRVPLLPVLAAQGLSVRRSAQLLPEPIGPRSGRNGRGPRLRLLIAGDSSAAGVGAGTQAQALSGHLVRELSRHYTVEWQLEAMTGHTTQDTLNRLQVLVGQFDMAVTALGVNDVTHGVTRKKFADRQTLLMNLLVRQFGVRRIVATGVPQMARFPALPQPLAWVLGQQAARLDQALQEVTAGFSQARHLTLNLPDDPALAAPDGYHPSPKTYAIWASEAATLLRQA
ncbi:SGNH/GDSL hydrolase family protein [Ruegeria sp. HKCCA5426]|uniref:SGNH/GDSL hydrolase family protein n=1 Tax=Ruegeria sp. HKCCA5426 TaxID=2682985 RepID=UPI0020C23879|nr:SGNH/GDSL hydrolase family protein [Ruegeria sp. HKCCA5426]